MKRVISVRGSQALRIRESSALIAAYEKEARRQSQLYACDVAVVVEATGAVVVSVRYEYEQVEKEE